MFNNYLPSLTSREAFIFQLILLLEYIENDNEKEKSISLFKLGFRMRI